MREKTTIQISKETKTKLDRLKVHPREPYRRRDKKVDLKNANNL